MENVCGARTCVLDIVEPFDLNSMLEEMAEEDTATANLEGTHENTIHEEDDNLVVNTGLQVQLQVP